MVWKSGFLAPFPRPPDKENSEKPACGVVCRTARDRVLISLYAAMLVTLGFLLAALLVVVFLPAYRRRIERFAGEELKRQLPLTEDEIRADKDRMRAEHAMQVHRLTSDLEDNKLAAARQLIEINRRDAKIHELDETIESQKLAMEEHENARRVLEQAILDRLPKVEQRLTETRRLLAQRDAEIALLSETSSKQTAALEEAAQINVQQREELQRLRTTLETRAARNREARGDARFDGEVALRAEIEALRAKTRDQTALIKRLQLDVSKGAGKVKARSSEHETEIAQLKLSLRKLQNEYDGLREARAGDDVSALDREKRVAELERNERLQAREISRLKAALAAREAAPPANVEAAAPFSGLSAKAEIEALRSELEESRVAVARLQAELASSKDKMAQQTEQFREELRRLSISSSAAEVADVSGEDLRRRPSLIERMNSPRPPKLAAVASADGGASDASGGESAIESPALSDANVARLDERQGAGKSDLQSSPRRPRLIDRISELDKQQG
jgi:hypothetical protein